MSERRHFDRSFKTETVRLILDGGRDIPSVAREVGVHPNTVYKWVNDFRRDPEASFPGKGRLKPADEELRRLQRQCVDLQEENAILKKAMAIFAKLPK
jgi:transposase